MGDLIEFRKGGAGNNDGNEEREDGSKSAEDEELEMTLAKLTALAEVASERVFDIAVKVHEGEYFTNESYTNCNRSGILLERENVLSPEYYSLSATFILSLLCSVI
jgi:hypothetical protein